MDPGLCLQAEMERALLQGEREAERALLQKEQKAVDQVQEKLLVLEAGMQKERDKVSHQSTSAASEALTACEKWKWCRYYPLHWGWGFSMPPS